MHVHYVRFDESVRVGVGGFVCLSRRQPFYCPQFQSSAACCQRFLPCILRVHVHHAFQQVWQACPKWAYRKMTT